MNDTLRNIAKWSGLIMLWTLQYSIVAPSIWLFRLAGGALRIGVGGVILLCVPVIGWIILGVLLLRRPVRDPRPSPWTPWGLGAARSNATATRPAV